MKRLEHARQQLGPGCRCRISATVTDRVLALEHGLRSVILASYGSELGGVVEKVGAGTTWVSRSKSRRP
jgi:hypothetical protein